MFDGVLQRAVVDPMPISAIDPFRSVFCQSIDLPGRRKWRLARTTAARLAWTTSICAALTAAPLA